MIEYILVFFFVNTQTLCTNQKGYKSKLINEINFCNAWFVTTKVSSTALLTGSPFFFKCPCVQISTLVIAEGVSLTLIYKLTYSAQDYQHKINYLLILWKLNQINLQQIIYHLILWSGIAFPTHWMQELLFFFIALNISLFTYKTNTRKPFLYSFTNKTSLLTLKSLENLYLTNSTHS